MSFIVSQINIDNILIPIFIFKLNLDFFILCILISKTDSTSGHFKNNLNIQSESFLIFLGDTTFHYFKFKA